MTIGIANDHHGVHLKEILTNYLIEMGYNVIDYGADTPNVVNFEDSSSENIDFPVYAFKLGNGIANHEVDFGVAICGSGVGVTVCLNKVKGVYCGRICSVDEAIDARVHDDANALSFSQEMDDDLACEIVMKFISTSFSGKERYVRRINMIKDYENE